ncbi:hypothetical protein Agub_g13592 [Astrephomene gubernaculifera]|uniref:PI3K/PI4K catalytic domain-containing protein n=1 Tax=Astrephomene gubernaculifera TaxID=47775 RepID=A0AAD3E2N2_9CHLO|nr:hypothetical protein Agub_g13592 [Astrephomene gubernaculifera]
MSSIFSLPHPALSRPRPVTIPPCVTPTCHDIGQGSGTGVSLFLRLHKRCTAADQPFGWSTSLAGSVESLVDTRAPGDLQGANVVAGNTLLGTSATPHWAASRPFDGTCSQSPYSDSAMPLSGVGKPQSSDTLSCYAPNAGSTARLGPLNVASLESNHGGQGGHSASGHPPPTLPSPSPPTPAEAVPADVDERCMHPHPGSVCCTTTTVEKDCTSNACVVTLKATVRLTDSRLHAAPSELEELAWLAARDAAAGAVQSLNRRSGSGPMGREERHGFVCHMLRHGTIRDARRMENAFGHVSYLLTLEDKPSGARLRAAFKPRVEGDCEGWHRVPVEAAAYQLNLLLGMDLVPPAVVRPACDVDWTHYPAGGAFIYWCGGARQLSEVPPAAWSVPPSVLLSDTRILDVLLQNSDRHCGHFLHAEHWADGDYYMSATPPATPPAPPPHQHPHHDRHAPQHPQQQRGGAMSNGGGAAAGSAGAATCSGGAAGGVQGGGGAGAGINPRGGSGAWRGRLSPVLVDHAAGFRPGAFVSLEHENAFLTGPTRQISARTYLRLRFLDAPSLRAALGDTVSEEEVGALLARRDAILAFFDGLVAEKGYENVVLEA